MARLPAISLSLLLLGAVARAQQPASDDANAARQHYDRGMGHFQLEEWDPAIEEWKEGFRIKPVPEFLYNIAQAYRLSKRNELAVSFYQKYLRVEPKAANKGEVERHIAQLNKLIEAQNRAQSAPPIQPLPSVTKPPVVEKPVVVARPPVVEKPPAVEKPPVVEKPPIVERPPVVTAPPAVRETPSNTLVASPPDRPIYKKGWFWGVVGGGVAVVTVAVVLGVVLSGGGDSTKTLPAARF
jgi:hypothetical protein